MKILNGTGKAVWPLVFLTALWMAPKALLGQVAPSGDAGGLRIWAGATGSYYYVQYGARRLPGGAATVDLDTKRRLGVEAEGRWLRSQTGDQVHIETFLAGLRYHVSLGRFQPYAKGIAGMGRFNFPYSYAHGSYLTVAAGGGVDFRLTPRIRLRLADCEYQYWPQFTFGAMNSFGLSSGIRVRVF